MMKIYHQCGHNFVWNIDSYREDEVGDGYILSPVNIDASQITDRFSSDELSVSWLDPQLYIPNDDKSGLSTYPYFPENISDFDITDDYHDRASDIARSCIEFQNELGLRYIVIPTRYYRDIPKSYLEQIQSMYVEPFLQIISQFGLSQDILLTLIVKPLHLEPGDARDEILTWATSFSEVSGIYLILEDNYRSKQIKDTEYLADALRFIGALRSNNLEVHIGYSGLEGLLYSIADPTSVTIGSYENLRSFDVSRLRTIEDERKYPPNPRIFSLSLLQWIEHTYLPPFRELIDDWRSYFDETRYKDYLLNPESSLNFQRAEIYKHYFVLFQKGVISLPNLEDRPGHIIRLVKSAIERFEEIEQSDVYLDSNSDGSHLPSWINSISMYERKPE